MLLPAAARCNAITMGAVACPCRRWPGARGDGLRGRVLGEIVSSERKYLNSLRVLEVVYKDVIQRRARHFGIRKESDIAAIFGNLTSLIDLHEEICAQMEANPESSPRVIREHSSWLALYVQYSNGYNDAAAQLTILTKRLPRLRDYLKQQEQDPRTLPIGSYLIMPIQRIPRYVLLLRELQRHTDANHASQGDIQSALDAVRRVAEQLNEKQRAVENSRRAVRIQSLLRGGPRGLSLVAPTRTLLRETACSVTTRKITSPLAASALLFSDLVVWVDEKMHYVAHCTLQDATITMDSEPCLVRVQSQTTECAVALSFASDAQAQAFGDSVRCAQESLAAARDARQSALRDGHSGIATSAPVAPSPRRSLAKRIGRWVGAAFRPRTDRATVLVEGYIGLRAPPRAIVWGEKLRLRGLRRLWRASSAQVMPVSSREKICLFTTNALGALSAIDAKVQFQDAVVVTNYRILEINQGHVVSAASLAQARTASRIVGAKPTDPDVVTVSSSLGAPDVTIRVRSRPAAEYIAQCIKYLVAVTSAPAPTSQRPQRGDDDAKAGGARRRRSAVSS